MVLGQLRVAVIGTQTHNDGVHKPYTVYRTVVNFRGQCYQRLLRFSQFHRFHKKLHLRDAGAARAIVFPSKQWTHSASLEGEIVEARQVLLNEYMDKVTTYELTPGCYDRLLRLLKVGDYDPEPARSPSSPYKKPLASMRRERSEVSAAEDELADKIEAQQARRHAGGGVNPARAPLGATDHIGGAATLVTASVTFRSLTSSADTVLTDDERSERPVTSSGSAVTNDDDDDEQAPTDDDDELTDESSRASRVVASDRPPLRASVSMPAPRRKKVQFDARVQTVPPATAPATAPAAMIGGGDLSPERKYRGRIAKQMSNIEDILSRYSTGDGVPAEFALSLPGSGSSAASVAARSRLEVA